MPNIKHNTIHIFFMQDNIKMKRVIRSSVWNVIKMYSAGNTGNMTRQIHIVPPIKELKPDNNKPAPFWSDATRQSYRDKSSKYHKHLSSNEVALAMFNSNPERYTFVSQIGLDYMKVPQSYAITYDINDPDMQNIFIITKLLSNIAEIQQKDIGKLLFDESKVKNTLLGLNWKRDMLDVLSKSCCNWLNQHFQSPDKSIKDRCFLLAHAWLNLLIGSPNKYAIFLPYRSYISSFIGDFLDYKFLGNLTAQELVFCIFLAGTLRRFPHAKVGRKKDLMGGENKEIPVHFEIPGNLEAKVVRHMPEFTVDEVDVVTHAFYKSRLLIQPENIRLKNSLLNFMIEIEDSDIVHSSSAIVNVTKMLSTHDHRTNIDQIELIIQKYEPLMHTLNIHAIIRLTSFGGVH